MRNFYKKTCIAEAEVTIMLLHLYHQNKQEFKTEFQFQMDVFIVDVLAFKGPIHTFKFSSTRSCVS